jgi:DNA-binding transcriptional ArsR family regulator
LAPDVAADVAGVFRALSDPTRVRLVSALTEEELSVGELAEALGMTLSAVSHQLGLLRSLRVVRGRRDGRHVHYSLDDEHVYELYRRALEHVSHGESATRPAEGAGGCSDGNQR